MICKDYAIAMYVCMHVSILRAHERKGSGGGVIGL